MLGEAKFIPIISVKNIEKAKDFYTNTLGCTYVREVEGGHIFASGGVEFFMYESEFAGTNQATAASWHVDDIEAVVEDLKAKGVTFEHYDFEWAKLEGDVHVMGDGSSKAAWFKDPDGNILALDWGEM